MLQIMVKFYILDGVEIHLKTLKMKLTGFSIKRYLMIYF
jgi:hypothetical protein